MENIEIKIDNELFVIYKNDNYNTFYIYRFPNMYPYFSLKEILSQEIPLPYLGSLSLLKTEYDQYHHLYEKAIEKFLKLEALL